MDIIQKIKNAKKDDSFCFICKHCNKTFLKTKKEISKNKYKIPTFCCVECQKEWYKNNSYVRVECKECGKEYEILKGEFNKNKNKNFFCSHSCSATHNNKIRKRITKYEGKYGYDKCPKCNKEKWNTSKLCKKCSDEEKSQIGEKVLGDFVSGHKYLTSRCLTIRKNARKILLNSGREKVCEFCKNHDFDDILEVHHIKGVLTFNENDKIKVINDINNLIWLCPNHHAMLEKGLIELKK